MTSLPKRLLFIAILSVLPAALLLLLAEGLLRVSGFGYATTPMLRVEAGDESVWVGNPDFTRLYFPAALKRLPPPNRVAVDKPAGTRRYMIVGGSAAAGDPDTDFSIARNLEWILSQAHPGLRWEVLNLAYTACNSHVAAEVVRQSGPYDLDGIIVLVGNNEVIGPYGPGTTLSDALPSRMRRALTLALRKTRIGQLGQSLRDRMDRGSGTPQAWKGMEHFLQHRIAMDDPRLEEVGAAFRANLEDMEAEARRRGIPIVLSTVPVNLLDQPPFQDDMSGLPEDLRGAVLDYLETGHSRLPLEEVLAAATAHPHSANLAYMAGRLLFDSGHAAQADALLRRACDLDRLRFRADSRINAIIRDQWLQPGTAWLPLDAEAPLIADSPRKALGFPHFYEHVHFSLRANFLIAREMAKLLLGHEQLDTNAVDTLQWTQAAAGLGYTTYDAWLILEEIEGRFALPPYTAIPGYGRITAWMDTVRASLLQRISTAEEKTSINAAYIAAIDARPDDDRIRLNFANFLVAFGQNAAAFAILEEIFPRAPADGEVAVSLCKLALQLGAADQAAAALRRIEQILPQHPQLESLREQLAALKAAGG